MVQKAGSISHQIRLSFLRIYKEENLMIIKEYKTELDRDKKNILCEICHYQVEEDKLNNPKKIADFAMKQLHLDRCAEEYVYVLGFISSMKVLGIFEISHGTVSAAMCNPREIFIRLLLVGASCFVLIHNHPSGEPRPSREDYMITEKLKKVGDLLGITLQDSIIIGDQCYLSMKEDTEAI